MKRYIEPAMKVSSFDVENIVTQSDKTALTYAREAIGAEGYTTRNTQASTTNKFEIYFK